MVSIASVSMLYLTTSLDKFLVHAGGTPQNEGTSDAVLSAGTTGKLTSQLLYQHECIKPIFMGYRKFL